MKLATLRLAPSGALGGPGQTVAARVDEASAVLIEGATDVGALLADPSWRDRAAAASGAVVALDDLAPTAWAPVVPRPAKIVCVGLNYREHILEMGRELPEHPTLFAKYAEALIGAHDDILVPADAAEAVDWEGELALVIGTRVRTADLAEASAAIAGYSVLNDVTMRDRQYRTTQWLEGKTFESTCPFGPVLVTADAFSPDATLSTFVNGDRVQHAPVDDLVFGPAALVAYVSSIVTLQPGDVITTGTPGGVGHALTPPRHLAPGDTVTTTITSLGTLTNRVRVLD